MLTARPEAFPHAPPARSGRFIAPPGRTLAFVMRGEMDRVAPSRRGGGNAVPFLSPPGMGRRRPAPVAKAIAVATAFR